MRSRRRSRRTGGAQAAAAGGGVAVGHGGEGQRLLAPENDVLGALPASRRLRLAQDRVEPAELSLSLSLSLDRKSVV